ncbi:MAG: hypothetical protein WBP85_15145, partial [Terracidiphilus sp.]
MYSFRLANLALVAAAAAVFALSCAAQTREVQPSVPYPAKPVPSDSATPYRTKIIPRTMTPAGNSLLAADHFIAYRNE